jgi:hypothetical protein
MSSPKNLAARVLRIILGLIAMACVWFVLGFIGGWVFWITTLRTPRIEQAFNVGLFMTAVSFILDPVLYLTWTSHFKRKKRDSNDA